MTISKKFYFLEEKIEINLNKFHISGCSWCGAKFEVKEIRQANRVYGLKKK